MTNLVDRFNFASVYSNPDLKVPREISYGYQHPIHTRVWMVVGEQIITQIRMPIQLTINLSQEIMDLG